MSVSKKKLAASFLAPGNDHSSRSLNKAKRPQNKEVDKIGYRAHVARRVRRTLYQVRKGIYCQRRKVVQMQTEQIKLQAEALQGLLAVIITKL